MLTTCFAVVLSTSSLGHAAAGAGPARMGATEAGSPASFVLASYNIRHALSDEVASADVQRLAATGADVIGLQEMGSRTRRDAVRAALVDCATCEFRAYMPNGSGPAEVPFLFRDSTFQLLGTGTQLVSEATYVGPDGAGPSTIAAKYLTWVRLLHRATGQEIYVINNHAVASVQAADGGPNYANPERLQLFRQHMDGLSDLVARFEATGAAVFTAGDFNVNYRRDSVLQDPMFPYSRMRPLDVYASYKFLGSPDRGTQVEGTRLIDQISSSDHPAIVPTEQSILTGYSSDHRPVLVRYAVATAPDAPATVAAEPLERSAQVTWTPAADNGSAVTSYTVRAVPGGSTVTVPGTATSAVVPGLTAGTSYAFVVQATNRLGTGPDSAASGPVVPVAVPPETTITAGPSAGSFVTSREATVGYDSSAAGSSFVCALDGAGVPCPPDTVRLASLSQATHVFSAAAVDADGDVDPSPAVRTWTVPLDSTTLNRTAGWSLEAGRGYYMGAYATTTNRHAVLSRPVSGMRRLALVATTAPGAGVVKVYLGTTLLRQVDLAAGVTTKGQVLPIARFGTGQSGKVRIVVASADKPVRVEGLGVATR